MKRQEKRQEKRQTKHAALRRPVRERSHISTPVRAAMRERVTPLTVDARMELGRKARAEVPRSSHGEWQPAKRRQDPVEILESQAVTRVPELVPIRYGRMVETPFAFFRGAAAIMAADLAPAPRTGLEVQLCGDAHLGNFGSFAGPDRRQVFDLNDFDETLPGPFEWDLKRLAASFEVAGRQRGFASSVRTEAVLAVSGSYRNAMRRYSDMGGLEIWYDRLDLERILTEFRIKGRWRKDIERSVEKSARKDNLQALERLTQRVNGKPQFISTPPLLVPLREYMQVEEEERFASMLRGWLLGYRSSISDSHVRLLDRYRFVDLAHMAHKVVGVGSVGNRAWVVLLVGRDENDPLVLQFKEAQASVLEPYLGASAYRDHGQRIVEGQRLIQAASDILLGWVSGTSPDGKHRHFYVRQLWNAKGSVDLEAMPPSRFAPYAELCGMTLARAHARSGDPVAISAYLGKSDAFDRALVSFAEAYAEVNEHDHAALARAEKKGDIQVKRGL